MYGRSPEKSPFPTSTAYDPSSYQSQLQARLAKLRDFVETHLTEAAHRQRNSVGHKTQTRLFNVGDPVWLSIPTAGKLDPCWEGKWRIHAIPGPVTYVIQDGAMSIACDIAFSQTSKAPAIRQTQTRTTPLGILQQWSITSL